MENIEKPVHEAPASANSSEPGRESTCDPAGTEAQAQEKKAATIASSVGNYLTNKTVNSVIIIFLTTLIAVSVGVLTGVAVFKKSAKEIVPSQPLRQAALPAAAVFMPMSSVEKNIGPQTPAAGVDEKKAPIAKRHGKKVVKARKHASPVQVSQISRESLEITMKAAKQGDAEAQYRLGALYAKGVGVNKDKGESIRWYRRAAGQGHAKAQEALEFVYE